MGDHYLVAKTDPITFATDEIGWYAVQVNANDLATTGAIPRWFMATVLLPGGKADSHMAVRIFEQIVEACRMHHIVLVGGHTEVTYGLDRPIVMGTLLGEVAKGDLVSTGGAEPGDVILLTKGVPIEAASIIAREKREELLPYFGEAFLDRAAGFLKDPGISVLRDSEIARGAGRVTSMHDPTEGGLATALWELAEASGHTVELSLAEWPIVEEARLLCAHYDLDPLGAIASGALLLTVKPESEAAICAALTADSIPVFRLGHMAAGEPAVYLLHELLNRPVRDEVAKLFD
jgi:hydrogenase maturation factor